MVAYLNHSIANNTRGDVAKVSVMRMDMNPACPMGRLL